MYRQRGFTPGTENTKENSPIQFAGWTEQLKYHNTSKTQYAQTLQLIIHLPQAGNPSGLATLTLLKTYANKSSRQCSDLDLEAGASAVGRATYLTQKLPGKEGAIKTELTEYLIRWGHSVKFWVLRSSKPLRHKRYHQSSNVASKRMQLPLAAHSVQALREVLSAVH